MEIRINSLIKEYDLESECRAGITHRRIVMRVDAIIQGVRFDGYLVTHHSDIPSAVIKRDDLFNTGVLFNRRSNAKSYLSAIIANLCGMHLSTKDYRDLELGKSLQEWIKDNV